MKASWTHENYDHPTRGECRLSYRFSGVSLKHIVMLSGDDFNPVDAEFDTVEEARAHWRWARTVVHNDGFRRIAKQRRLPLQTRPTGRGPYRSGT